MTLASWASQNFPGGRVAFTVVYFILWGLITWKIGLPLARWWFKSDRRMFWTWVFWDLVALVAFVTGVNRLLAGFEMLVFTFMAITSERKVRRQDHDA